MAQALISASLGSDYKIHVPDDYEFDLWTVVNNGFHFVSYYAIGVKPKWDPSKSGKQTITIQGAADIFAYGEPNAYTVRFDSNSSLAAGTMEDQDMVYNEPQKLFDNKYTCPGGKFTGWNTARDGSGDKYSDGQEVVNLSLDNKATVTFYAQWDMQKFSIDYDLGGGSLPEGKTNPVKYTAADPSFTLVNPLKTDYDFEGWIGTGLKSPERQVTIEEGSVGNRKYTAFWNLKHFMVTFDSKGGSRVDSQRVAVHGNAVRPEDPTRENYVFDSWYTEEECENLFDFSTPITRDTVVYAKWTVGLSKQKP